MSSISNVSSKRNVVKIVCAALTALSLLILYLIFLGRYVSLANWSSLSQIETWIFITMIIRVIALVALRTRYQFQPLVPIILFSVESLLIPPLLGMYIFTGYAGYAQAMGTILTAWLGVSALVLSPYLAFSFARSMITESSLWGLMTLSILEFASMLFISSVLAKTNQPISGLTGLGAFFVISLRDQISNASVPFASTGLLFSLSALMFYIGLLAHATMGTREAGLELRLHNLLLLPLIATMFIFMWTSVSVAFTSDILYILTIPTLVLAMVVWGVARGKA
ncbi:MAG TPA: hypothetical protein VFF30_04330 [Nitrososphaerales archaeon]|nr:hypothetical protein [Nitrososphaerales archaeon]